MFILNWLEAHCIAFAWLIVIFGVIFVYMELSLPIFKRLKDSILQAFLGIKNRLFRQK